jgi:hypothetical protein
MFLWLGQTAHDQEVVGLNRGTVYWMDVSVASYYIKEKYENKCSQMRHTKKYFEKKKELSYHFRELSSKICLVIAARRKLHIKGVMHFAAVH